MTPFKRIKIGDRIINLEHVVSAYRAASGQVAVELTSGTWVPNLEDGETFWDYFLRSGLAIKAGEFALNRSYIAMAHRASSSRVSVGVSCDRINPFFLLENDARQFWEDYTGDCIDLGDYQPPRAKLKILDQFSQTTTAD